MKFVIAHFILAFNFHFSFVSGDWPIRVFSPISEEEVLSGKLLNLSVSSDPNSKVSSFSLCYRVYLNVLDKNDIVAWLDDYVNLNLRTEFPDIFIGFQRTSFLLNFKWDIFTWTSLCISFKNSSGSLQVVKDGETVLDIKNDESVKILSERTAKGILENLRISLVESTGYSRGFTGSIADVNMWDTTLYESQMKRWTSCENFDEGNLLAWNTSQWSLTGFVEKKIMKSVICGEIRNNLVPFMSPVDQKSAKLICQKVGGEIGVCTDSTTNTKMGQIISNYDQQCERKFWCGISDEIEEGIWRNINTEDQIGDFSIFGTGEPNGQRTENCVEARRNQGSAVSDVNSYKWNDAFCMKQKCFLCQMREEPLLRLRGLEACDNEYFDTRFRRSTKIEGDRYVFSGLLGSKVIFNQTSLTWTLSSKTGDSNVFATFSHDTTIYPIGRKIWNIQNKNCLKDNVLTELDLTSCDENSYNCNDGTCIDMAKRCDLDMDCPDRSDEMSCTFLDIPSWYLPDIIPPARKATQRNQRNRNKIEVEIDVMAILDVDVVHLTFETQFRLKLSWYDSRLSFINLKDDQYKNWVTQNESKSIWVPVVRFHNTETMMTSVNDIKAYITIQKNGNYTLNSLQNLENNFVFTGAYNRLTITRDYDVKFRCNYNLKWYPFDTQLCSMNLTLVKADDANFLELIKPSAITHMLQKEVQQYNIQDIRVEYGYFDNGTKGIGVHFELGRQIIGQMMTVYIPTLLINLVSYLTTIFNNSKWFGHIITINLTAMLVLTTMLTSISDDLPKTAEFKFIDVWMLFCLMVPVLEIILHTIEDVLKSKEMQITLEESRPASRQRRNSDTWLSVNAKIVKVLPVEDLNSDLVDKDQEHEKQKKITKWTLVYIEFIGNFVILILIITFNIIYWSLGLLIKYKIILPF